MAERVAADFLICLCLSLATVLSTDYPVLQQSQSRFHCWLFLSHILREHAQQVILLFLKLRLLTKPHLTNLLGCWSFWLLGLPRKQSSYKLLLPLTSSFWKTLGFNNDSLFGDPLDHTNWLALFVRYLLLFNLCFVLDLTEALFLDSKGILDSGRLFAGWLRLNTRRHG